MESKFESKEKESLLKKLEENIEKLLQDLLPKLKQSVNYGNFSRDYSGLISAISDKNYHGIVEILEGIESWIFDPDDINEENSLAEEITDVKILIKIFLDPESMELKELKEIVSN